MDDILHRLKSGEVLISDGAMGTMLFHKGLKPGDCPEKINLDKSDILEEIAQQYLGAGAEIIHTNTFGGSPLKLAMYSLDNRTEEINIKAIRAVRHAIGRRAYLSLSCGPSGKILKPYGDTDPEHVYESFRRQLKAALAEGIDMITIETMTDMAEAKLAVSAARSLSDSIPICATMTFDKTPDGYFTIMGVSVEQAVNDLVEAGADIIGSNCGNGIKKMVEIAAEFRKHTDRSVMIQSNAGLPEMKGEVPIYSETPEYMAEECRKLLDLGVNIIGGCCGTTPEHITAIKKVVDGYR
jgi:5-methyltetrahydrofolate--homocysteine methyltransferase